MNFSSIGGESKGFGKVLAAPSNTVANFAMMDRIRDKMVIGRSGLMSMLATSNGRVSTDSPLVCFPPFTQLLFTKVANKRGALLEDLLVQGNTKGEDGWDAKQGLAVGRKLRRGSDEGGNVDGGVIDDNSEDAFLSERRCRAGGADACRSNVVYVTEEMAGGESSVRQRINTHLDVKALVVASGDDPGRSSQGVATFKG